MKNGTLKRICLFLVFVAMCIGCEDETEAKIPEEAFKENIDGRAIVLTATPFKPVAIFNKTGDIEVLNYTMSFDDSEDNITPEQILTFVSATDGNNAVYKTAESSSGLEYNLKIDGKNLEIKGPKGSVYSGEPKLSTGVDMFDEIASKNGFTRIDLQTAPATPNDFTRNETTGTLTINQSGVALINNPTSGGSTGVTFKDGDSLNFIEIVFLTNATNPDAPSYTLIVGVIYAPVEYFNAAVAFVFYPGSRSQGVVSFDSGVAIVIGNVDDETTYARFGRNFEIAFNPR